jgi:molybdopterin-binding protein
MSRSGDTRALVWCRPPHADGSYDVRERRAPRDKEDPMQLSARNQLHGRVKSITEGNVMAEVIVEVAGQELVSAITKNSVRLLGLKEGTPVLAVIKATEVLLATEDGR